MVRKFAALAAVAVMAATPAFAADAAVAQLGAVKGSVMVNGKASAGALKAGDRVVAAKGSASVKFADGCTIALKANSMITVGAKSPCATGAGVVSANSAQPAAFADSLGVSTEFLLAAGTFILIGGILYAVNESVSP